MSVRVLRQVTLSVIRSQSLPRYRRDPPASSSLDAAERTLAVPQRRARQPDTTQGYVRRTTPTKRKVNGCMPAECEVQAPLGALRLALLVLDRLGRCPGSYSTAETNNDCT